jgi:hypothetical protein
MGDFRRRRRREDSCGYSNEEPSSLVEIGYAMRAQQNCCHRLQGGIVIRMRRRPNRTHSEDPDLLWESVSQAGRG